MFQAFGGWPDVNGGCSVCSESFTGECETIFLT